MLVTGAAGDLGAIGRNLSALARRQDARAEALRRFGAEVVQGDLTDLSSLHRAIEGCARLYFGTSVSVTYLEATVNTAAVALARSARRYVPSQENNKAFGRLQSFVAGPPTNGVQFMVKDSSKYASTGGWGFVQFKDGRPADEAVHHTCFCCHEPAKARDFVFTRYAP